MEANFFRFLVQELGPQLKGRRIEKVYKPYEGVWNFQVGTRAYLLLMPGGKREALFYSQFKPDNPEKPSGEVQWWRKHVVNKKIVDYVSLWPNRQLALKLSTADQEWILIDLKKDPQLRKDLPENANCSPGWPSIKEILTDPQIYTSYPQISPPLRKTIYSQSEAASESLLNFLRYKTADTFYLYSRKGSVYNLLPWCLPRDLSSDFGLEKFASALQAAERYGWGLLKDHIANLSDGEGEVKRRLKKIRRNIKKLEQDEQRLQEMASLQEDAELIRNHMYKLGSREKISHLEITDYNGKYRKLHLDPRLNLQQNMEVLFNRAQKGRRGLQAVKERKELLQKELNKDQKKNPEFQEKNFPYTGNGKKESSRIPKRLRGLQLHYFLSSEGFTILRGKNKKSNHKLLSQAARPFDFWFHVQQGPGAHVILRRDYFAQDVPRNSILEAASLAALSSYQSMEDRARVMLALVKDVRHLKGAELGQVQVDVVQESLLVTPHRELERTLKLEKTQSGEY